MINDKLFNDKAKIYSKKKIPVHITKEDGEWLNGLIKEVDSKFLMIDEFKKGKMPVFFREIVNIETYTGDREARKDEKT